RHVLGRRRQSCHCRCCQRPCRRRCSRRWSRPPRSAGGRSEEARPWSQPPVLGPSALSGGLRPTVGAKKPPRKAAALASIGIVVTVAALARTAAKQLGDERLGKQRSRFLADVPAQS